MRPGGLPRMGGPPKRVGRILMSGGAPGPGGGGPGCGWVLELPGIEWSGLCDELFDSNLKQPHQV